MRGLSGNDCRFGSFSRSEYLALGGADDDTRLRATTIDADYDLIHFQRLPSAGSACVRDERIPIPIVNEVPMSTNHGKEMCERVVSKPCMPGKIGIICLAKTIKLMTMIPTAMPRIASR